VRDAVLEPHGESVVDISTSAGPQQVRARVVVGADGGGSRVARAANVISERNLLGRAGITFHQRDPAARPQREPMHGRFFFGRGWYVGIAPVHADRVNIGIVVPIGRLAEGVENICNAVVGAVARPSDRWPSADRSDEPQAAGRLEHHVKRVAGDRWLLVGDATGFIDPLTGEGLHRALRTAELAIDAIDRRLSGDRSALAVYDRRVRSRFRSKNVLSVVLQAFLANPLVLDRALRRLERSHSLRAELTLVLADQVPATRALDPRFLARVLAP
jgi:flavin-dependent dehydrogenase